MDFGGTASKYLVGTVQHELDGAKYCTTTKETFVCFMWHQSQFADATQSSIPITSHFLKLTWSHKAS